MAFDDPPSFETDNISVGATLSDTPLMPICSAWLGKIERAMKFKKDRFQNDADEATAFYECGKKLGEVMWSQGTVHGKGDPADGDEQTPNPKFRLVVGKTAELVQRFGPAIYHQNPTITVEPKTLEIPDDQYLALIPPQSMQQAQMQAQQTGQEFNPKSLIPPNPDKAHSDIVATVMQYQLNYMQRENKKMLHSRRFAEEALIKGMGVLWTEYTQPYPDAPKMIVSTFDTVNNFVFDPDADRREEALWCARYKLLPIWEVAQDIADSGAMDYKDALEYLKKKKGVMESVTAQEEAKHTQNYEDEKKKGRTNDLIEVWEVWSKMGMGQNLSGVKNIDGMEDFLRSMGDNIYLRLTEKVPFPLNLHHDTAMDAMTAPDDDNDQTYDSAYMAVQWPIPFWEFGEWPYTDLAFRESPDNAWPMPYIKPAMGHLKFINWAMSFLVNKVQISCTNIVSCMKALDEQFKQRLLQGKDFRLLEIDHKISPDGDASKAVHFHTMPPFQQDIYKVIELESEAFDKATGLTSLMYGSPGGMRSSAEAQQKAHNANAPLDDMASRMEDAMSMVARKEAMALRWISEGKDVQPVIGQLGASLWDQYVASKDFASISREYHYRIEAGSTRKPNKEQQSANISAAMQALAPVIQWTLGHNDPGLVNFLMEKWCEANDFELDDDLLPKPAPPQPNPEMLKIQAEIEGKKQEMAIKQQEGQQRLQHDEAKMVLDLKKAQMKMQVDRQKATQDFQLNALKGQQEMQLAQQHGQVEMAQLHQQAQLDRESAAHDMRIKNIQAHQQIQQTREMGQMKQRESDQKLKHTAAMGEIQKRQAMQPVAAKGGGK